MTQKTNQQKITPDLIRKIASLSKLSANPDEDFVDLYTKNLNEILDSITTLQAVDTYDIKATDAILSCNLDDLREDEGWPDQEKYKQIVCNIISGFPQSQGSLLKAPIKVVE